MAASVVQYSATIAIACIIGCAICVYSYYLAGKLEEDDEYEALCDFGEHLSCTKFIQSEYGRGFGLIAPVLGSDSFFNKPNGLFGLLFYAAASLLGLSKHWLAARIQTIIGVIGVIVSSWVGYALLVVVQEFCVLWQAGFMINIAIAALSFLRHQRLRKPSKKPAAKKAAPEKPAPARKTRSKKD